LKVSIIGAAVGNMMATIINTQFARNIGAPIPMVGVISPFILADCQANKNHEAAAKRSNNARMTRRWRACGTDVVG
jgi:hypothetical protein